MTTERSGMSLEAEAIALADMLERFAVSDTEAAEGMDENYEADHWADVQSGLEMNADTNRKAAEMIRRLVSFAARHAAVPDGIAVAAAYIQKKADDYAAENCGTEYDTGATTYHYGQAGMDYHHTLIELAEEVAMLAQRDGVTK